MAVRDPPRRDDGNGSHRIDDGAHQGLGGHPPGVPSGLASLGHDDVGPAHCHLVGGSRGSDQAHHHGAGFVKMLDPGAGVAEPRGKYRRCLFEHDLHQLFGTHWASVLADRELTVAVVEFTRIDLGSLRLRTGQQHFAGGLQRQQQVDTEGFVGEFPDALDFEPQTFWFEPRTADHSETSGVRYRGGKFCPSHEPHPG